MKINHKLTESMRIRANRLSIANALYNIVNNATQHAKDVRVVLSQEGNMVKIEIIDNGGGIAPEFLVINPSTGRPYLFDMNVSQTKSGTGLGTTEAWYAIKDTGGRIDVKSKLSKGTTFTIYLPIAATRIEKPQELDTAL